MAAVTVVAILTTTAIWVRRSRLRLGWEPTASRPWFTAIDVSRLIVVGACAWGAAAAWLMITYTLVAGDPIDPDHPSRIRLALDKVGLIAGGLTILLAVVGSVAILAGLLLAIRRNLDDPAQRHPPLGD